MTHRNRITLDPSPAARRIADLLFSLGATHVVSLPDNASAPLLDAVQAHGELELVLGTREGEVISLASGLWLGGARPLVLIQNTGLLESGDGLRGTASRMGAPLLLLITCRGFATARAMGAEPGQVEVDREILVRPDIDSVAHMTHATLRAWGIPFFTLEDAGDPGPIQRGWDLAYSQERPVAVLIDTSLSHE
ncbi:MAG: thiamine pyrophosphate-binding protein [Gemmatimonadota bacterium]